MSMATSTVFLLGWEGSEHWTTEGCHDFNRWFWWLQVKAASTLTEGYGDFNRRFWQFQVEITVFIGG